MWFPVYLLLNTILISIITVSLNTNSDTNSNTISDTADIEYGADKSTNYVAPTPAPQISSEDYAVIEKFRPMVDDVPEDDFEKTNSSLLRWIRANKYNLAAANKAYRSNYKFKKSVGFDTIMNETPLLGIKRHPCITDGFDKEGNPIAYVKMENEDIRRYMLAGLEKNVTRLVYKCAAGGYNAVKEVYKRTGNENVGLVGISDISGYNLKQHACFRCIKVYTEFLLMYELHTPQLVKLLVAVNAPTIAKPVADMAKSLLPAETAKLVHLFGYDKKEWTSFLLDRIAPDQLAKEFGGTRNVF
jgi:hypothetical protein